MSEVAYKRDEAAYKRIIDSYLANVTDAEGYITAFMGQWRQDRDKEFEHPLVERTPDTLRFGRLMDRLFTSCDCFDSDPQGPFEINEDVLRDEVRLFRYLWWGE